MNENNLQNINFEELDKNVRCMVKYFNLKGLKTSMSCEGHNKTNMSMYWILFDDIVTKEDIVNFMKQHLSKYGPFISNGKFAKRIFVGLGESGKKDDLKEYENWYYFAGTKEAALGDLEQWLKDDERNKGEKGMKGSG